MLVSDDLVDPPCPTCGLRRFSDCVCVDPRYRPGPREMERQLRGATGGTLTRDLPEAQRLAVEQAR